MATTAYTSSYTGAQIDTAIAAVGNKADAATTLSGYGITDAYTKTESDGRFYMMYGGTQLTPSSGNPKSLATCNNIGVYWASNVNAPYCTDKPTTNNVAFRLYVMSTLGGTAIFIKQIYQEYNSVDVYERSSTDSGTTWGSWVKVQGTIITVYSGSSAPSSSTGSDGDIYIQTS